MIEHIHALEPFGKLLFICSVRTIGIGSDLGPAGSWDAIEAIAVALYLMIERKCAHIDILGTVDKHRFFAGHGFEDNVEIHTLSEEGPVEVEHGTQGLRTIYIKGSLSSIHGHGAQQAEKAEEMVAMDMGDEYGLHFHEGKVGAPHLLLRAFAAVDKKQAPVHS